LKNNLLKKIQKQNLVLRKTHIKDAELLFNWVNEKDVRENSFETSIIEWKDHMKWLEKKLKTKNVFMLIAEINNIPVGQIRFEKYNSSYIIDYSINENHRGQGIGGKILKEGIKFIQLTVDLPIIFSAKVKSKNIASKIIFEKLQFNKKTLENSTLLFELKIP
jgi:RimJ/RimL family protein N-acetyltransferase